MLHRHIDQLRRRLANQPVTHDSSDSQTQEQHECSSASDSASEGRALRLRDETQASECLGIKNPASVEQLQETLIQVLQVHILKNYPQETSCFTKLLLELPDLRTLSMQSEKLLSFCIDAQ
ncbi:nuclear receptor subfamily 1 group D member 1 [Crotalus adamanteus]|uniref:Nuclear receptor subfamily 1 group D member 1 n=1 Tax=Crotalus adamanteus TaxID=8729 RepID=A0AAW1B137_CROAD